jgi:hypothetical protein
VGKHREGGRQTQQPGGSHAGTEVAGIVAYGAGRKGGGGRSVTVLATISSLAVHDGSPSRTASGSRFSRRRSAPGKGSVEFDPKTPHYSPLSGALEGRWHAERTERSVYRSAAPKAQHYHQWSPQLYCTGGLSPVGRYVVTACCDHQRRLCREGRSLRRKPQGLGGRYPSAPADPHLPFSSNSRQIPLPEFDPQHWSRGQLNIGPSPCVPPVARVPILV